MDPTVPYHFPLQWPFSFFGGRHRFLGIRDARGCSLMHGDGADVARGGEEMLRRLIRASLVSPTLQPLTARHSCDADRQHSDQRASETSSNGKWHTGQSLIAKTASADRLVVLR